VGILGEIRLIIRYLGEGRSVLCCREDDESETTIVWAYKKEMRRCPHEEV